MTFYSQRISGRKWDKKYQVGQNSIIQAKKSVILKLEKNFGTLNDLTKVLPIQQGPSLALYILKTTEN